MTKESRTLRRKLIYDASDIPLYVPLDLSRSTIRLLLLKQGHEYEEIDCSLMEVDLDRHPEYTALSYTWGPPIRRSASLWTLRGVRQYVRERMQQSTQSMIILDGQRVPVTANLEAALRHLRSPEGPLFLWVDAVCINQEDPVEKQCEVGRMGRIYSQAKQTIVWLGPEADGSNRAMDFIATSHSIDVMDPKFRIRDISPPWPELQALFARSWWSRIWVMQEALLSKDITVKCGHKEAPFGMFAKLAMKENGLRRRLRTEPTFGGSYKFSSRWTFIPPTTPFYTILHLWYNIQLDPTLTTTFPIWEMMTMSTPFNATLPRDKIYGLLGVCDPKDRAAIEIDYTGRKTDSVIFRDAIAHIIKSRDHIRPLQYSASGGKTEIDWPSWVPDLSQANFSVWSCFAGMGYDASYQSSGCWLRLNHPFLGTFVLDYKLLSSLLFLISSTVTYRVADMLSDSYGAGASFSDDDNVLILRGIPFDTISYADPAPDTGIFRSSDAVYLDQERRITLPGVDTSFERWERAVASFKLNPYRTPEGRYAAFWRTMIGNRHRGGDLRRNPAGHVPPPDSFRIGYELWRGARGLPDEQKGQSQALLTLGTFQGMVGRSLNQRSFAITGLGYLGLVPKAARNGDLICVFQGGEVPFVLRPIGNDQWELVGECYVHGIMDGEVVKKAKPEDIRVYYLK